MEAETLKAPVGMSELPEGWQWLPLSKVADNLDSKRKPINAEERETRKGDVPYYGATGQVGWIDTHLLDEEVVLVGEDGAPFLDPGRPKAYMVNGKSWVNNHAHILRARDGMPNAYLMHYLNILDYSPYVSGTTRLKLTKGAMNKIPVPVAPHPQQRRIVSAIELQLGRLDAAVARLLGAKAKLKRYKQAVLKAAFDEGESVGSDGWQELTIGDIATRIVVGYVGPMTAFIVENDGVPLVSTTHIGENEFLAKDSRQVTRAFHAKNKKSRVIPGDILIARHGDSGKACIVPGHIVEAQVSNAVILSVDTSVALPEYVCYRVNFERTVMQESRVGGVLQVVNTKTMEAFPIKIPSLGAQRAIVDKIKIKLSATEQMETTLDAQLVQAGRLRQAVLKRAFEGRLV
jgi:type I restriction enzyme S subunit